MLKFWSRTLGLLIVLTFVLAFTLPGFCDSTSPDLKEQILSGIEQRYAKKGFSTRFEQTSQLTALDISETASGKAWFKYPGKMRWIYELPDHHEIITDGKTLWIFRPQENQVMTGKAQAFFESGAGGAFLSDITRIRKDFTIELEQSDTSQARLRLVPKHPTQELAAIRLTVGLPGNNIQAVATENAYGDITRFSFSNIRFDDPDPAQFMFSVPDDAEVIEMN